jgi:hypothetical protein
MYKCEDFIWEDFSFILMLKIMNIIIDWSVSLITWKKDDYYEGDLLDIQTQQNDPVDINPFRIHCYNLHRRKIFIRKNLLYLHI